MKKTFMIILVLFALTGCATYCPGEFCHDGILFSDGEFLELPNGDSDGDGD